jgi:hypothetical protein
MTDTDAYIRMLLDMSDQARDDGNYAEAVLLMREAYLVYGHHHHGARVGHLG